MCKIFRAAFLSDIIRFSMSNVLRVNVCWTNGTRIPIVLSEMSPVRSILELCMPREDYEVCYPFLIHDSALMDLNMSLKYHGVEDGDVIVIHDHSRGMKQILEEFDPENLSIGVSTYDEKIYSMFIEFLRIQDNFFNTIDGNGKSSAIYKKIVDEFEQDDEKPLPTVINEESKISTDPLPMIFPNDEVQEDCVQTDMIEQEEGDYIPSFAFNSIEEAGKFFSQQSWSEWDW